MMRKGSLAFSDKRPQTQKLNFEVMQARARLFVNKRMAVRARCYLNSPRPSRVARWQPVCSSAARWELAGSVLGSLLRGARSLAH